MFKRNSFAANTATFGMLHAVKVVIGFVVTMVVARYLGPERFGILSLALAIVGILTPLNKMGLDGIGVRELVYDPEKESSTLGGIIAVRLAGIPLQISIALIAAWLLDKPEYRLVAMVAILCLGELARIGETGELWLRANKDAVSILAVRVAGLLVRATISVALVIGGMELVWFAFGQTGEMILVLLGFAVLWWRRKRAPLPRPSVHTGMRLGREGLPFLLSAAAALIYQKIDLIMLSSMSTTHELGLYSAAVRICTVFFFVSTALDWAAQPIVMKAHRDSEDTFWFQLRLLSTGCSFLAYIIVLPLILFSDNIIMLVFGSEFEDAGLMLSILAPSIIFIYIRIIRGPWILVKKKGHFAFAGNVAGAAVNVAMNFYLIPLYGGAGAAVATVASYSIAFYISTLLMPGASRIFLAQSRGLLLMDAAPLARRLLSGRHSGAG